MDSVLSFIIEDKNLYLEQVLVEYDGIPIYFLCKDENSYYLALCIDTNHFAYYVSKMTILQVYDILYGHVDMKEPFVSNGNIWEIISDNDIKYDKVTKISARNVNKDVLPYTNAKYKILDENVKKYAEQLSRLLFDPQNYVVPIVSNCNANDAQIENEWDIPVTRYVSISNSMVTSIYCSQLDERYAFEHKMRTIFEDLQITHIDLSDKKSKLYPIEENVAA